MSEQANKRDIEAREAEYTLLALMLGHAQYAIPGVRPEVFADPKARGLIKALQGQLEEGAEIDGLAAAYAAGISAYDYVQIAERSYGTNPQQWEFIVKGNYLLRETDRIFREAQGVPEGLDRAMYIRRRLDAAEDVIGAQQYTEDSHEQFVAMMTGENVITPTGIPVLDNWFGGFEDGDFVLVAARPSVGKTAFGTTLAFDMARGKNIPVDYYSYEMSAGRIRRRVVARLARVENKKIRFAKRLTPEQFNACMAATEDIKRYPVRFLGSTLGVSALCAEIHRTKSKVVIVDYLGIVPPSITGSKKDEITDVSNKLRGAAKASGKIVIALVQMNRDQEKMQREPILSDLRDSGELEQDADFVFFIHEIDRRANLESGRTDVEVKIIGEKMRDADVGWKPMRFAKRYSHFYDQDVHHYTPPPPRFAHEPAEATLNF